MKSKKATYFFLFLTLVVWGLVVFRIYNSLHDEETVSVATEKSVRSVTSDKMTDTFSIYQNYRDPFKGKITVVHSEKASDGKAKQIPKVTNTVQQSVWPTIQYSGMIKNQKSNKQLAMLTINGANTTMKIGELNQQIELCGIYKDSVEVKFNKEKRFIRK